MSLILVLNKLKNFFVNLLKPETLLYKKHSSKTFFHSIKKKLIKQKKIDHKTHLSCTPLCKVKGGGVPISWMWCWNNQMMPLVLVVIKCKHPLSVSWKFKYLTMFNKLRSYHRVESKGGMSSSSPYELKLFMCLRPRPQHPRTDRTALRKVGAVFSRDKHPLTDTHFQDSLTNYFDNVLDFIKYLY